jgi:hypothetical protein
MINIYVKSNFLASFNQSHYQFKFNPNFILEIKILLANN